MTICLITPQEMQRQIADRLKARRLEMNLSQEGLAVRSGVSLSSLKRFERTGLIALHALLRLTLVLDCLNDFEQVGAAQSITTLSLDEILAQKPIRKKGRRK